jgi:hypothetical protein
VTRGNSVRLAAKAGRPGFADSWGQPGWPAAGWAVLPRAAVLPGGQAAGPAVLGCPVSQPARVRQPEEGPDGRAGGCEIAAYQSHRLHGLRVSEPAREDPVTASRQLSEAIPLLEAKGESCCADLATAWYNLATAQMKLSDPVTAASSYLKARDIEAAIYGQDHPDLISTEYSLAASLHACADFASAEDAINRCLRIIRQGGQQARAWRQRALIMAIILGLEDKSPSA